MSIFSAKNPYHPYLKWTIITLVLLLDAYLVMLMYAQGEYLFALFTLLIITAGVYIFSRQQAYAWRYIFPGLMGMVIFVLFPLVATVAIAFTNYSGTHQLSFERALSTLLDQRFFAGEKYPFKLYATGDNRYDLLLENKSNHQHYLAKNFGLDAKQVSLIAIDDVKSLPAQKPLPLKAIIQQRKTLQTLHAVLPNGDVLSMSSLRQFSQQMPRYHFDETTKTLTSNETGQQYKANEKTGFFQEINKQGQWLNTTLEPGFIVSAGFKNFLRIFTDEGIQKPFVQIFIWTVVFAALTVVLTGIIGMVLACLLQWEALRGKAVYRLLLILPYAVPAFISILVFKGLFNQSFGEINLILGNLFGISPKWFNDPFLAKTMLIIVNTWLGYPYFMLLCMGLLKSIPQDLYEASAIDGATPVQNFCRITAPLLLKPLAPLMIASFAFNFNNFVLVDLLTNGGPDILGTTTPAGHTDLLVSYTYRIAFDGSGTQDFGLAAAIATLIFLLVSGLAMLNMKVSKMKID